MVFRIFNSLWHHIRYIPLLSALSVSRGRAFDRRSRALGALVGLVVRYFPIARRRVERELSNVYPGMPRSKRLSLCRDMGRNMGRTLFEIFHCRGSQRVISPFVQFLTNVQNWLPTDSPGQRVTDAQ